MTKCDFCKEIITEKELVSEFHKLEDELLGTYYYLVYNKDHTKVLLETISIADDPYYSQTGEIEIDYCPMCGKRLKASEER